jgi:flagellar biogenesis protein FliO
MPDSTQTATHVAQVVGANAAAWSVAFSHINEALTALSLVLASAYTIYKFIQDHRRKKK